MSSLLRSLPLIALAVVLLPSGLLGQDANKSRNSRLTSTRHKVTDRARSRRVTSELQRQQEFLRDVTARFEAVASHDFTPLFQYSYVWTALKDNRDQIAKQVKTLTPEQSTQITKGYDELEKEVVALFGDHQLGILNGVLELNEQQVEDVQKAVEDDLNARRVLLKTKDMTLKEFALKVDSISDKTETRILALLFPEQRKRFDRELNFTRDRLLG